LGLSTPLTRAAPRKGHGRQEPAGPESRAQNIQALPQPEQPRQPQCVHSMIRPCNQQHRDAVPATAPLCPHGTSCGNSERDSPCKTLLRSPYLTVPREFQFPLKLRVCVRLIYANPNIYTCQKKKEICVNNFLSTRAEVGTLLLGSVPGASGPLASGDTGQKGVHLGPYGLWQSCPQAQSLAGEALAAVWVYFF
jgi:hypothetical protein